MDYVILITPEDKIEIKEYVDYHTLNDLVDGWYERCGWFGATDKMCMIFCNEEFLFQENCSFNAIGTILAGQPIYGNVVVTIDGYNENDERDALPMNCAEAQKIEAALNEMKTFIEPHMKALTAKYKDKKPTPTYEVVTEEDFFKGADAGNE